MESAVTILVCGISGVGKTSLIRRVLENLPEALTWRASEIIGEARNVADSEYLRKLPADELRQSQELLVKGYERRQKMRAGRLVLLDAHAVLDTSNGLFDIPTEIIRRLAPSAIVHIEDVVELIAERRASDVSRTRPERTLAELALYQSQSLERCQTFKRDLGVPLARVRSGDGVAMHRFIALLAST